MTTVDEQTEAPGDTTTAPPDDPYAQEQGADGSGAGETPPPPAEPTAREKELERRLRAQGTELAQTRRYAAAQAADLAAVKDQVAQLTARQSATDKESAERRQRETENYLNSLPPEKRTAEELRLLKAEVQSLKSNGTAAQARQPAATTTTDESPDVAYMRARAHEILTETQEEFGVEFTQEDIASLNGTRAWDSEESFEAALARLAAKKVKAGAQSGGTAVANKPKTPETEAQMRERITREVQADMGAGSPAAPRAAGRPGRRPTEEDVKATVNTYNSAAGPKANIAKLKEMRAKMEPSR